MDIAARAVTVISGAVSLVMLFQTVRKMVKEAPVSKLAPIVAVCATLLTTLLYLILSGASVNWLLGVPMVGLGALVGWGEGHLTRLHYRGTTLMIKRSVGYLILWSLAYLVTMLLAQVGDAALHAVGILAMVFGVGTALGSNAVLLVKQAGMRPTPAPSTRPRSRRYYVILLVLAALGLLCFLMAVVVLSLQPVQGVTP
jgi:hypothetical protein